MFMLAVEVQEHLQYRVLVLLIFSAQMLLEAEDNNWNNLLIFLSDWILVVLVRSTKKPKVDFPSCAYVSSNQKFKDLVDKQFLLWNGEVLGS